MSFEHNTFHYPSLINKNLKGKSYRPSIQNLRIGTRTASKWYWRVAKTKIDYKKCTLFLLKSNLHYVNNLCNTILEKKD